MPTQQSQCRSRLKRTRKRWRTRSLRRRKTGRSRSLKSCKSIHFLAVSPKISSNCRIRFVSFLLRVAHDQARIASEGRSLPLPEQTSPLDSVVFDQIEKLSAQIIAKSTNDEQKEGHAYASAPVLRHFPPSAVPVPMFTGTLPPAPIFDL
jgi:hypothetical protein